MKKVTIYTGDPCSFCEAAKALLKTKNVQIEEHDVWKDPAKAKEMLQRTNGARAIPQIFIEDHYIEGGFAEKIALAISRLDLNIKIDVLGVTEVPKSGTNQEILDYHGLSSKKISEKIMELIKT